MGRHVIFFRRNSDTLTLNIKLGTHWGHEVISMLLAEKAENVPLNKVGGMLEVISAEELENQPSPRLLNCHFPLGLLPTQMKGNYVHHSRHCSRCGILTPVFQTILSEANIFGQLQIFLADI